MEVFEDLGGMTGCTTPWSAWYGGTVQMPCVHQPALVDLLNPAHCMWGETAAPNDICLFHQAFQRESWLRSTCSSQTASFCC